MTRITTEAGSRLVGALIGLVRATDGAVHMTDDTHNIIIEGLHTSDILLGCSDADIEKMITKAHADKHAIVPDCSVCGAPCGRTADYDWESVYRENDSNYAEPGDDKTECQNVSDAKIRILASLQSIAHRVVFRELAAGDDITFNLCRAVFALGENWSSEELETVWSELEVFSN